MRELSNILKQQSKKRKKKDEFLYILSCGDMIKIGVTNDITSRLSTLQTGNPIEIKLEYIEQRKEAYKVEAYLHQMFSPYHIKGEWFKGITVNDVRIKILMCHHLD